ncbi:MAG: FadR family transcriptional regulator [Chloroflexi bacterium]|nr:FadR family transcriptional regulator [Chloroflexota bacterium]
MPSTWSRPDRASLAQQVAGQILAKIREGALRPGDPLPPSKELAQQLGVGLSVVREAIQALVTLDVVKTHQGQRSVINPIKTELLLIDPELVAATMEGQELAYVYEARSEIELVVALLVCERATDDELAGIQAVLDEEAKCVTERGSRRQQANDALHLAIAEAAHNPVLASILTPLMRPWPILRELHDPTISRRSYEQHRDIVAALRRHDPAAVRAAVQAHGDHMKSLADRVIANARLRATRSTLVPLGER